MRSEQHAARVERIERVGCTGRLIFQDIERGTKEAAGMQRGDEGGGIDQRAAADNSGPAAASSPPGEPG